MAVKKTKKLSAQTTTTTVATGEKFAKVDANGKVTLIGLADLKAALLDGLNLNNMMDGVFILYYAISDNHPMAVKPHNWPVLQNNGQIAAGVLIVEGGKVLVVSPTEADSNGLLWSSADIRCTDQIYDRIAALNDWDGETKTAAAISKSTSVAVTNTSAYAPGFCNLYSRVNVNGKGLTAGKWWLPSLGEMLMIYANLTKINYCLSLISGATPILEERYWTSTEASIDKSWHIHLGNGYIYHWTTKAGDKCRVRPVSAFYYGN